MRILVPLTIAIMALAGCTAPDEDHPLLGVCPQWIDADDSSDATINTDNSWVVAPDHEHDQWILDRFTVTFSDIDVDGIVEVRAHADSDERLLRFTDYRKPGNPQTPVFLAFGPGDDGGTFDVFLTAVAEGTQADPDDLRITVEGKDGARGSIDVDVMPGYRVCGAPI